MYYVIITVNLKRFFGLEFHESIVLPTMQTWEIRW